MTATDLYPGLPDPETQGAFYRGTVPKRFFAWIVDVILIGVLTGVVVPFTFFTGLLFLPVLYLVLSFLYRWVMLATASATLGMQLAGIEFRTRFGERLDSGTAFLHTAGYTVSMAIFPLQLVSIALMIVSERGQGLTDHVIGTAPINRFV